MDLFHQWLGHRRLFDTLADRIVCVRHHSHGNPSLVSVSKLLFSKKCSVRNRDFKELASLGWFSRELRRPFLLRVPGSSGRPLLT